MVVTCTIEFDQNVTGCYFAGQMVSGTITLKCEKSTEVNAILLSISGYASTLWSERSFFTKHMYQGREDYLSTNSYLMGSEHGLSKSTIAAGVHNFNFACQLPQDCPSSYEGQHGHIRYTVKVGLVRPWKFDINFKRGFTVLRMTDLNFESPQIRIPSNSEAYRSFLCGPCTTEPIKMELKIPQAGYVPGQSIPVQALIINNSNIAVSEVRFALIMIVRYISQNPTHHNVQRISVSKIQSDGVLRNCTRSLRDLIHVPATPPTCLHACGIIQIHYQVEMEVVMKSFQKTQTITIPVIIGNIPLANNTTGLDVIQQQPSAVGISGDNSRERPTDLPLNFINEIDNVPTLEQLTPHLPPPSYEESYHTARNDINEGEQHALDRCEFTPLYPVFDIPSPTLDELPKNQGIFNKSFIP
ncbi:hypothetical protein DOY81_007261 [Sarcophaga bullata]|nr:hypothetical protein DOY81_007261 [Sarcophaga bullata]